MDKETKDFIKEQFGEVNKQFGKIDKQFGEINKQFSQVNKRFDKMDGEFKSLKSQVEENTQILKALEHKADVNKAEHDNMTHDIAEVLGEVKSIRKDLTAVEYISGKNMSDIAVLKAVK